MSACKAALAFYRKLCGSMSTWTRTEPRSRGPCASIAADIALHVGARGALDEQPEAVAAGDQRERRLGRDQARWISPLAGAARRSAAGMALGLRLRAGADDDPGEPAERRQPGCARARRSRAVEGLGVARNQRLHHRMLGLIGLQQAEALAAGAAGPAGHLAEQLEGALGGAQIAVGQAEIGVDHADQRQVRESCGPWRRAGCR